MSDEEFYRGIFGELYEEVIREGSAELAAVTEAEEKYQVDLEFVFALVENLNQTLGQAMETMKISPENRRKIAVDRVKMDIQQFATSPMEVWKARWYQDSHEGIWDAASVEYFCREFFGDKIFDEVVGKIATASEISPNEKENLSQLA